MSLAPGTRLGPYEITAKLGEGGMGEVYRATDSKLKRQVAIKVLPAAFTDDKERLARFEREAQLLAQLHHPNIASIFGLEESNGVRALVMELVEGEDLSTLLQNGPLPISDALAIARQLAEALEAAHDQGIVHRDLKPQNIKVSTGGQVKVLDFGLAKAMDAPGAGSAADLARSPTLMNSPTLTGIHGTQLGVILGSAAYMSPEQAKGMPVDKRADIWAFGVVVYEMLSGQRLFGGDSVTETLASVLRNDIDLGLLPASAPPALADLLRRCLERNPRNRLRDIGDARLTLEELQHGGAGRNAPSRPPADTPTAAPARARLPWLIAAVAGLVALGSLIALALGVRGGSAGPPAPRAPTAFGVLLPEQTYIQRTQSPPIELASDGRTLFFVAENERGASIYRRGLDRLGVTRIEGSDGAEQPIVSPDGRWIVFFSEGRLRKVDAEGGKAVTVAEALTPRGASWMPDGSLVFSPVYNTGLWRVPATGGEAVAVSKLDASKQERTHRWPQVLPDGKTVIFTVGLMTSTADYDGSSIDAIRLDTGERRTILEGARMARYSAAGYLVFQRRSTLLAVRFDPVRLERMGEPFVIQEGVGGDTGGGAGYFAVSATGALAYVPEAAILKDRVLVLVDRAGKENELAIPPASFIAPKFSPTGDRLVYAIGGGGLADDDVYLYELAAQRVQRLTFNQSRGHPVWSPDGRQVLLAVGKSNYGQSLATRSVDGSGVEVEIPTGAGFYLPDVWLPDGSFVVSDVERTLDVVRFDPKSRVATPLFATETAAEYAAALSPDGRYIAYASSESVVDEIFVSSFPPGNGKWQVSTAGGTCPAWSTDGRELYFVSGTAMMAVDVETVGVFRSGPPRPLFSGPYDLCAPPRRAFDVGPDGRFVIIKRKLTSTAPRELVLLDGWQGGDPARQGSR